MPEPLLQERKRYNEAIEACDMNCMLAAEGIGTHLQTTRGGSVLILYETMYRNLFTLFNLTGNLDKVKDTDIQKQVRTWLYTKRDVIKMNDADLIKICQAGMDMFLQYHNLLMDQGYISLPGR